MDPIQIFEKLDKESGKEDLRRVQETVLRDWYSNYRDKRDLIIKLHTGQGKTLLGLLMLQSYLNEDKGPAMYICPNNYLVNQTIEQARQFGIRTVQSIDSKLPQEFLNSEAILVATCNKLFNGMSVFGVQGSWREPVSIGALVIDDAHKCLDIIKESFSIRVDTENSIYSRLWTLFEDSLNRQAQGTCIDIKDGKDCFMAVPFWSWFDRQKDVLGILSEYRDSDDLRFV